MSHWNTLCGPTHSDPHDAPLKLPMPTWRSLGPAEPEIDWEAHCSTLQMALADAQKWALSLQAELAAARHFGLSDPTPTPARTMGDALFAAARAEHRGGLPLL